MKKGIKLRIYPNKSQQELLSKTFGCVRLVYNIGLSMRQTAYKKGENVWYAETSKMLTELKKKEDFSFLRDVDAIALQQTLRDLDVAFKNFFAKRSGYPHFKSKHSHNFSYRTVNCNNNIRIEYNHIKLPKIGWIKIKKTMEVGSINYVTVKQNPSGKYYAILNVDFEPEQLSQSTTYIGLDVGIKNFCVTSNGDVIKNPQYWKKSQKKLIKEQRRLSHKKQGSHNWEKQRIKVARIYEHIINQQNDFLQKLSTILISENQVICVEDLDIKTMLKNHILARSVCSVSWAKFFDMLKYKANWYGRDFIKIPTFYPSSQICSACGYKNPKTKNLSIRRWICPNCGAVHDRDYNAAKNILNKGLTMLISP